MLTLIKTVLYDITRDTGNKKTSNTKVISLLAALIVTALFVISMIIMYNEKKIDHLLIGEATVLLLTLLGFKNFKTNNVVDEKNDENKDKSNFTDF